MPQCWNMALVSGISWGTCVPVPRTSARIAASNLHFFIQVCSPSGCLGSIVQELHRAKFRGRCRGLEYTGIACKVPSQSKATIGKKATSSRPGEGSLCCTLRSPCIRYGVLAATSEEAGLWDGWVIGHSKRCCHKDIVPRGSASDDSSSKAARAARATFR